MTDPLDLSLHVYVEALDAWVPADQVQPDGTAAPLDEKVAGRIREIIEAALDRPEVREAWLREEERKHPGQAA